ncbi:MAG: DUF4416 family protein [Acidobacteria bacterium]|nr:DUF4416 family protein [Acidobacteriota bacterium]
MADLVFPSPTTLFVALLYPPVDPRECIEELSKLFGPVCRASATYAMTAFSSFYEKEMGTGLQKHFISFVPRVPMDQLAECKLATHKLEKAFERLPGRRTFNIDPGLLTSYSVILSTLKNHAHRIYLRDGVFAEVTLIFRDGAYHPLPWTYADYQSPLALRFFQEARPGGASHK